MIADKCHETWQQEHGLDNMFDADARDPIQGETTAAIHDMVKMQEPEIIGRKYAPVFPLQKYVNTRMISLGSAWHGQEVSIGLERDIDASLAA